jgi:hypothetical protein
LKSSLSFSLRKCKRKASKKLRKVEEV